MLKYAFRMYYGDKEKYIKADNKQEAIKKIVGIYGTSPEIISRTWVKDRVFKGQGKKFSVI